jgi:hypothetical protein
MISPSDWISPTRMVGMAAHLLAAIVCGCAWVQNKRWFYSFPLVPSLAILETALFLDAAFNWRWMLHGFLVNTAVVNGVYGQRSLPQMLALLALSGMACCALTFACRRLRGRPGAILAIIGGVFSAALWLVEVISLHATDIALQAQFGPVMVVAVVWVLTSAATAIGIYWDVQFGTRIARTSPRVSPNPR